MTRSPAHLARCSSGGAGAEFALVVPLVILFLFGIIDVGRVMWTWNQAEKATQMGVRYAITTDIIAAALGTYTFTESGIPQGDPIPKSAFGGLTCDENGCVCRPGETCPALEFGEDPPGDEGRPTSDQAAFTALVNRMQAFYGAIGPSNVEIDYDYSGHGYAGDPYAPDVAALVTVRLKDLTFRPIVLFGGEIGLPSFSATLTLEDGEGTFAN